MGDAVEAYRIFYEIIFGGRVGIGFLVVVLRSIDDSPVSNNAVAAFVLFSKRIAVVPNDDGFLLYIVHVIIIIIIIIIIIVF